MLLCHFFTSITYTTLKVKTAYARQSQRPSKSPLNKSGKYCRTQPNSRSIDNVHVEDLGCGAVGAPPLEEGRVDDEYL